MIMALSPSSPGEPFMIAVRRQVGPRIEHGIRGLFSLSYFLFVMAE